jgi:peptidoglycan L-alanyl-D-glutamate endopeptidase CwlK
MKFGIVPPEVPAIRTLDGLAPKFRAKVERLIDAMHAKGYDATIAESLRTDERQHFLYGFGRDYDDGRGVVTNAPTADAGWHKFGLAVDIISSSQEWDAPLRFWVMLGALAQHEGLAWGGAWDRFPDRPHVQWGEPMRRSPSRHAVELYAGGGLEAVWREVQAL